MTPDKERDTAHRVFNVPYSDGYLAVLKALYSRGCDVRLGAVRCGLLMAHAPRLQGGARGHIDVMLWEVEGGLDVNVRAHPYGSDMRNGYGSVMTCLDLLDSVGMNLDPRWSGGEDLVTTRDIVIEDRKEFVSPPPRELRPPSPRQGMMCASITALCILLLVSIAHHFARNEWVDLMWPFTLVTVIIPVVAGLLCAARWFDESSMVLDGGGVVVVLALIIPTMGLSAILVVPLVISSVLIKEASYWQDLYERLGTGGSRDPSLT